MDFQGFQHILPPVVIILLSIALVVLAWASYRKFSSIPSIGRWALISLRGSALLIVLLLLLNPYFYSSRQVDVKPSIAVFLDNSESIGITKGEYEGLSSYNQLLNTLNFDAIPDVEFRFFAIGEQISNFDPDSLNASETQTNLAEPIKSILEMEEQVQAALIISDGIITFGRNPSINAANSSIPLYTIAVGDTSSVRDVSISNILTNTTGYTNTNHIIEAEISQSGFANNTVIVSVLSGDEVLNEQQVSFDTDNQVKQVQFELELTEEGLKQYEVRATPLPDEWTESNNSRLFTIDVLDSKVKILHAAFQIHPDVKAIRSVINEDENNDLSTLTWLGGNRYVEEMPEEDEFNLIIVHGTPPSGLNLSFLSTITDTPTIFFELNSRSDLGYEEIETLRLLTPQNNRVAQVRLNQILDQDEQPILELPEINLNDTPSLYSVLRSETSDLQSTALYSINFDGINTESPAIAVLEQGNIRRSHVLPWGWYKWVQSTNSMEREYASTFIANLVSWTSSDPDNRKLRIAPAKKTFSTAEAPVINASLRNERGDPEAEGIIEVQLNSEAGTARSFNMESLGNGNYSLTLPRLSEGLYSYQATARKGEREIESQSGEFLVSNSSSELTNTLRDDALLKTISANSGGRFFTYKEASAVWDSLRAANVLQTRTQTVENYTFPVRSFYWFAIVLLLLGSEWLLRKYYSLP
ncbi:MAG: hypothetical protein JJ953_10025 [Gracilimonas sp.]|uniref:hypothetical protein n=1 Tax=Gracilimonas sp. TaxID=1974203 RepID=UPI001B0AFE65|nr:hypothetical protein [Gracilimonas sp.]MBO6586430.1 hypothetical protein [Gracilimonas sp.]MBO6615087.1 hypothetical protein [Gracilimonas sp.]